MNRLVLFLLITIPMIHAEAMPTGAFDPSPYREASSSRAEASELRDGLKSLLTLLQGDGAGLQNAREAVELLQNTKAFPNLDDIENVAQLENELLQAGLQFKISDTKPAWHNGIVARVGQDLFLERLNETWVLRGQPVEALDRAIANDAVGRNLIRSLPAYRTEKNEFYEIRTSAGLRRFAQLSNGAINEVALTGLDCDADLSTQNTISSSDTGK